MKRVFTNSRLKNLWILGYLVGALIAIRLVDIQLVRYNYYKEAAEKNRTQTIYQAAPRGNIFTSDGTALAASQPSFDLYYLPAAQGQKINEEEINTLVEVLAPLLKEDVPTLMARIKKAAKSGKASVISENISVQNVLPIAEIQNYYHGIYLIEEAKRYYPQGSTASHLIGYLGSMEGAAWKERDLSLDYRLDSKIGRFGMERKFEKELKGSDGGIFLEVDYRGRVKRIIEDKKFSAGADIYTTINLPLQRAAELGLKNSTTGRGAAVALDPRTGAVLAIASAPDFDPNIFVPYSDENTEAERKKIKAFNLAVQGTYPPASTFKIITAFAAIEENKLNTEVKVNCDGTYDSGPRVFKCWSKHGQDNFWKAMADSCDVYFYTLSNRIGPAPIERVQRAFQFGKLTEIDIAGERSGNLFGPTRRARNKSYWFVGDTLNLSIGQGELLVTPVKMAQFAAALASKGKIWRPYFVEKIITAEGIEARPYGPKELGTAEYDDKTWDIIFKALKGVTDTGTARIAKIKGLDVYAKTGTAQNPHGDDHAWFMAYAARSGQTPDIALAVFVENGIGGAGHAGPIAREMLKAFYNIQDPVYAPRPAAPAPEIVAPPPAPAAPPAAAAVYNIDTLKQLKEILEGAHNVSEY